VGVIFFRALYGIAKGEAHVSRLPKQAAQSASRRSSPTCWAKESAGLAEWYARDAQLTRKLAGIVEAIDEHLTGTKVSNSAE